MENKPDKKSASEPALEIDDRQPARAHAAVGQIQPMPVVRAAVVERLDHRRDRGAIRRLGEVKRARDAAHGPAYASLIRSGGARSPMLRERRTR